MDKEIQVDANLNALKNAAPALFAMAIGDTVLALFSVVLGGYTQWLDYHQNRLIELTKVLADFKEDLKVDMVNSEEFKDVFIRVQNKIMSENSLEKRKLFYSYIVNVGKEINPNYDKHSKLVNVLDQMTLDEFVVLEIYNGKLQKALVQINSYIIDETTVEELLEGINMYQIDGAFDIIGGKPYKDLQDLGSIVKVLGNFRLLSVYEAGSGTIGGGGKSNVMIGRITDFGKEFLEFVCIG